MKSLSQKRSKVMTEDKVVDKHKYGQTKDNLPAVFMSGNRKQCEYQAPWFTLPHQPEVRVHWPSGHKKEVHVRLCCNWSLVINYEIPILYHSVKWIYWVIVKHVKIWQICKCIWYYQTDKQDTTWYLLMWYVLVFSWKSFADYLFIIH